MKKNEKNNNKVGKDRRETIQQTPQRSYVCTLFSFLFFRSKQVSQLELHWLLETSRHRMAEGA